MPYMHVGSSPDSTTTHRGTPRFKKAIDGSRSGAHREQGCSSRCGCAFHMHAALRRPPVYVISMQNRLARNLTPGYTIAHDRRHQGAVRREWSSSRVPCGGGCCGEFHACLQPCQRSRGLYTASTPITARRNYTPFTYLQNHGMGQGLGNG